MSVTFKVLLTVSNSVSLRLSFRRRLRAEGPGGAEDYGAGCSDQRICLLFDVTPHQIPHEEDTLCGGGGSCAVGRLGERWPGGTLHTMPLHVCLPCQQCDPVSCPGGAVGGRGGSVLHFTETATRDTPIKGIIHIARVAISLQHNPE